MSIYSNDNIRKIAKLTTRELPQKSKNAKITVRENNGLYSTRFYHPSHAHCIFHFQVFFLPHLSLFSFKAKALTVNAGELGPRGKLGPDSIWLNEIRFFLLLQ